MCGERYCLHWRWIAVYPQGLQSSWCLGLLWIYGFQLPMSGIFQGKSWKLLVQIFMLFWVIWKAKKTCWRGRQGKLCGNNPTIFGWIWWWCSVSPSKIGVGPTSKLFKDAVIWWISQRVLAIDVPPRWYHRARPQQWGLRTSGHLKVGSGVGGNEGRLEVKVFFDVFWLVAERWVKRGYTFMYSHIISRWMKKNQWKPNLPFVHKTVQTALFRWEMSC